MIFLQLYLAYLLVDFVLRPDWFAEKKPKARPFMAHAAIHIATACLTVNIGLNQRVLGGIVVLVGLHMLLHYVKARLSNDTWIAFAIDQAAHVFAVAFVSLWLMTAKLSDVTGWLQGVARFEDLYLYLCAYVAVVFGGGFFVQRVAQSFLEKISADAKKLKPGLPNAGKYIGWVERFLILTFVIGDYGEAIGFLLAAKALARYPQIKEDTKGHFAEYFLVGTLTSVGLALVAGLLLLKVRALM